MASAGIGTGRKLWRSVFARRTRSGEWKIEEAAAGSFGRDADARILSIEEEVAVDVATNGLHLVL